MDYHEVDEKLWRRLARPTSMVPAKYCKRGRHLWPAPPLFTPGLLIEREVCAECKQKKRRELPSKKDTWRRKRMRKPSLKGLPEKLIKKVEDDERKKMVLK